MEKEYVEEKLAEEEEKRRKNEINFILIRLIISTLVILVFFSFLIRNTVVVSGSMEPTLMTGDYVVYNKLAYLFKDIQRGDIVTFISDEENKNMSKRVIGIEGDSIDFRDGFLFINGCLADESEYLPESFDTIGRFHYEVPKGHIFVMGDNREHSTDSRGFEKNYIPVEKVEGKYAGHFSPFFKKKAANNSERSTITFDAPSIKINDNNYEYVYYLYLFVVCVAAFAVISFENKKKGILRFVLFLLVGGSLPIIICEYDKCFFTNRNINIDYPVYESIELNEVGLNEVFPVTVMMEGLSIKMEMEARVDRLIASEETEELINEYIASGDAFYSNISLPDNTHWEAVEFSTKDSIYGFVVKTDLRDVNGENLVFEGIEYSNRTFTIYNRAVYDGEWAKGYIVFYAVPNGCEEYAVVFGDAYRKEGYVANFCVNGE